MNATAPPPITVTAWFAMIAAKLCVAVARHAGHHGVTVEMVNYVAAKIRTIDRRFQRLVALIQAGKAPPERDYAPRGPRENAPVEPEHDAPASAGPVPVWKLLNMGRPGWLCVIARNDPGFPCAAIHGEYLARRLETAEMRALLAASPRLVRLLKPLCRGLGVDPNLLPALPPRPRPARRVVPKSPAAVIDPDDPPMRPIFPSIGPPRRGKRRERMFAPGVPLRYSGVTAFG